MSRDSLRARIVARLTEDLVGPLAPDEVLTDRPTQRYSTGILYPRDARMQQEDDVDGALPVNVSEDATSAPDDSGVSLHSVLKPAAAGLSFALEPHKSGERTKIELLISCATYKRFAVDGSGEEIEGEPRSRSDERWRRTPLSARLVLPVQSGETRLDLGAQGIDGLELYALVTPQSGLLTVTLALSNQRKRGEASWYDEEQHFFQVSLAVTSVLNGSFAPRPSRRAQTDDDSRTAALIYRDVKEYVVGHTCSARVVLKKADVHGLTTDWVPTVVVPRVSDRGDAKFERLHEPAGQGRPLDARWLSDASTEQLVFALEQVVTAYKEWIATEDSRVPTLPASLQAQAHKHVARCQEGAQRMAEGISVIRSQANVRRAFQLAQSAMAMQFGWSRAGAALMWRPFQLAFQLLVLASLADRKHSDRDTMDLLWFPTGGGKTEAYLALAAFVILLRRLQSQGNRDSGGVAVLMRYTLRLLTIQQFQRAAAMICACEILRRRTNDLGVAPIGIGLWVGGAATPSTLKEAVERADGDPSTPEQLTVCPCCGSPLKWLVTRQASSVRCTAESGRCDLATGSDSLPVWTIDEEIYRHAPSLLIGTVDKFAQIVRKPETGLLFGIRTPNAPPDLIIQDELHLISGPLGSMAGLYEVAIDELCRSENIRPKIIGSTATIRRAEEQIRALFNRSTFQFPPPGLDASNSGFAVVDEAAPGRLYVGVTTAGRSATYMLQALVASLLQSAADSSLPPEERDYYWTLVAYFNSLRELGRGLVLMQDDVPISVGQFAARRGEPPRSIEPPAELTSRVASHEIRDMLQRLGRSVGEGDAVDLLVASNMISVGMDIPRLGLMVVNAQPKTLAEYIQATSRVGRGQVPGLVVTMYNSMRVRDRSHYETFETWHKSLYRDVEATSVTPFASRAQDKALHAVLVALVRHLVPSMLQRPILDDLRRADAEKIASAIEQRVAEVDPRERANVSQRLQSLIEQWLGRPDLQTYWDDYNKRNSLLMSAEQFAAKVSADADLDSEGARRALWPTPNSMREVEPGTPFVLRSALRAGDS